MQLFILFALFFLICTKIEKTAIRVFISVIFSVFFCVQLIAFYMTGDYLNTLSLAHIELDILISTWRAFMKQWILALCLLIGLSCVFAFFPRKLALFSQKTKLDFLSKKTIYYPLLLVLVIPLRTPDSIGYNIYSIIQLKTTKKSAPGFEDALLNLGVGKENYTKLKNITVQSSNKKNIIMIVIESFEKDFLDRSDLTPNLNALISSSWTYYDQFESVVGTRPTVSSLYALMTGLPYEFAGEPANTVFRNRAVRADFASLPAILKQAGYVLEYIGADPNFAGTNDLLQSLGFDSIKGYASDFSSHLPVSAMGAFDKDVLSLAKDAHARLMREGNPFLLQIATLDTHFPSEGYDPRIPDHLKSSSSKKESIIRWMDALLGDFIEHLRKSGAMKNTVVLIMPDHTSFEKPFPETKKRSLYLLTNASPENTGLAASTPLTHYAMPQLVLAAAGLKTNAVFFNDFFLNDVSQNHIVPKIKTNLDKIAALNMALLKSDRTDIVISRKDNAFHVDFGTIGIDVIIDDNKVAIIPLEQYAQNFHINPQTAYLSEVEFYATQRPCLLIIPGQRGFEVLVNPLRFFTKHYETQDNTIHIPVNDIQEIYRKNKSLVPSRNQVPQNYYYEFKNTPDLRLSLVSVGKAGMNAYRSGVYLSEDPLSNMGLGFGLSLVTANSAGIAYTTFDVGAGTSHGRNFLAALKIAMQSSDFWAVIACRDLMNFSGDFSIELQQLGLSGLAEAVPDAPYLAYRGDDGKIMELRPGVGDVGSSDMDSLAISIFFSSKDVAPILNYYDANIMDQIAQKEKLDYYNMFWTGNGNIRNPDVYIAHAGSAIESKTYTNSLEAVLRAIKNGFKFIELDLLKTTDGHIIAAHDWAEFNRITGHPKAGDRPLTLNEVLSRKIHGIYTPLSEDNIRKIFAENPNLFLVTDKIRDYPAIAKAFPFVERLIVEVFSPQEYLNALDAGILYPAYCMHGPDELNLASAFGFKLVTASGSLWAEHGEALKKLHAKGVAIMLYDAGRPPDAPFDTADFFRKNIGVTMSKYYSDFWAPAKAKRIDE